MIMSTTLLYTIQSGDTLSSIASNISGSAGVTTNAIVQANPSIDPNTLSVGQNINIPALSGSSSWIYVVQSGDTLSLVAEKLGQRAGLTYQEIEAANPNVNPNALQVGELLSIPETGAQPAPDPTPVVPAENIGYWDWTWSPTAAVPGATLGLAFSGWANIDNLLSQSAAVKDSLVGEKYISLGGGAEDTGAFTAAFLSEVTDAIHTGKFSGWDGLAYDVEVGDSGLADDFAASFAAAKAKGFQVLVTVSHSAPYGISDAVALMQSFFANENIDCLSPQLYTSGSESSNDYADPLLPWSAYKASKALIVPSIVKASYYSDAVTYFAGQGITLSGYIQWAKSS